MNLLMNGDSLSFLLFFLFLFWITPIIMLIVGIARLKSRPKNAKTLLIISGIWLIVGVGACGAMLNF